jgi:hypothetical protein
LADKSTRLILEALGRAAAEPAGVALLATKTEPGLFPPSATARSAAERCKDEGWLRVIQSEAKGRAVREVCVLTDKGLHHWLHQSSPRQVLEDFVRVLEARQADVNELVDSARRMQQSLEGVRTAIEEVLPRLQDTSTTNGSANGQTGRAEQAPSANTLSSQHHADEIKARLHDWHAAAGTAQDCPLPDLFRRLDGGRALSIGVFHDCLRQLHDRGQVYLHPWTGPLYALPEPAFALLVGHEIAYYASVR